MVRKLRRRDASEVEPSYIVERRRASGSKEKAHGKAMRFFLGRLNPI